jgi:DNA (cytosine-5)-methyltransferase 1
MTKPKLLDLFCGAGGCSMGYSRAGFDVTGVDIKPQPHYPFRFIQADALTFPLEGYDCYHASPPCQAYTRAFSPIIGHRKEHPDLVSKMRELLIKTKLPFVIENVVGAPLENYIVLDGTMFGLETKKERWFELHGVDILLLPQKYENTLGMVKSGKLVGSMQHTCYPKEIRQNRENLSTAYGIDWFMTRHELRQAIPPAYTEFIGKYLMKEVLRRINE